MRVRRQKPITYLHGLQSGPSPQFMAWFKARYEPHDNCRVPACLIYEAWCEECVRVGRSSIGSMKAIFGGMRAAGYEFKRYSDGSYLMKMRDVREEVEG